MQADPLRKVLKMDTIQTGNLFEGLPDARSEEVLENLAQDGAVRIERIVSRGQVSPSGFWYDQDQNEWVILLRGAARIEFEYRADALELRPGDYVNIPRRVRHRVGWTAPDETTVWLAVWYGEKRVTRVTRVKSA
jgi:cupin 2 domain-containing protein